jgi:hypothetical protein
MPADRVPTTLGTSWRRACWRITHRRKAAPACAATGSAGGGGRWPRVARAALCERIQGLESSPGATAAARRWQRHEDRESERRVFVHAQALGPGRSLRRCFGHFGLVLRKLVYGNCKLQAVSQRKHAKNEPIEPSLRHLHGGLSARLQRVQHPSATCWNQRESVLRAPLRIRNLEERQLNHTAERSRFADHIVRSLRSQKGNTSEKSTRPLQLAARVSPDPLRTLHGRRVRDRSQPRQVFVDRVRNVTRKQQRAPRADHTLRGKK